MAESKTHASLAAKMLDKIPLINSEKQFNIEALDKIEPVVPEGELAGGARLITRTTVELTTELAMEILELPEFKPDRGCDDNWVAQLVLRIKNGSFRQELVQIIVCTLEGKRYRINGQHCCWARVNCEMPDLRLNVQMLTYHAENEHDMRQLYTQVDRAKPRTKSECISAMLFGSDKFPDLSKKTIKQLSEGLTLWQWGLHGIKSTKRSPEDISYLLEGEYYGLALKVAKLLIQCQSQSMKHMRRSPVYAAMFATVNKNEVDANTFWLAVRDGTNLNMNDPQRRLRDALMSNAINAVHGGGLHKSLVPIAEMYTWCVNCWNAFRAGEELKVLRSPVNNKVPTPK